MIEACALPVALRRTARRIGLGRALLGIHTARALTVRGAAAVLKGKVQYLPRILNARPLAAGEGPIELHMLLHHQRALEGIWAIYSFAHFTGMRCQVFIHSDGSLTVNDVARLQSVMPGAHVISPHYADSRVVPRLRELGLLLSIKFREQLIFARKLFDPFFFGDHTNLFLLDSDVLFFRRPDELIEGINGRGERELTSLYSPDNGCRYCLSPATLLSLLGQECIADFNPGVVRTNRSVLNLEAIETYLQRPEFWGNSSRPHYYGELTLWAMLLTQTEAQKLPPSYGITPPLDRVLPTSGHYCGGGYPATWFYSRGLPRLAREFGI
jgi:hypothetical protein